MTYAEAIQFLYGLQMFGANFGLETPRKLAALVGNPQTKLRFIHVAGTNGKGSTCAMLESIYRAAGLRVGLFTSPHLVSFRERIQIDRQLIPESEVERLVAELQALLKEFSTEQHPTMFEVVTVMALKYFAEQKCDLVIWETGLGGRLDATNIVTPLASVITNIGFDHMEWLGDTLAKIASEKAGIIKPGVPVITAATQPEVLAVIEKTAQRNNTLPVRLAEPSDFTLPTSISLLGDHQKLNAALAVATVDVLQSRIPVTSAQHQAGLAQVRWAGRLQLFQKANGQKILLDGAHNLAGAEVLCAALAKDFPHARPTFIVGALADKQWVAIGRMLAPLAAKIFTVSVASKRTVTATELAEVFSETQPTLRVVAYENLARALVAGSDDPFMVITGSLYLVGEALDLLGLGDERAGERGLNEWSVARR